MTKNLKDALHRISLAAQSSMSSKEECGRIAREALAADNTSTGVVEDLEARLAALEAAVEDLKYWRAFRDPRWQALRRLLERAQARED